MSIHGVLGENTSYPRDYSPQLLFAIKRDIGRKEIYHKTKIKATALQQGFDIWQAFEVSWLNLQGVSKVALARIHVPADSPNIVESKSLKLYLNSLNFSRFCDVQSVAKTIQNDVSSCIGAQVLVQVFPLDAPDFQIGQPVGECIDDVLDDGSQMVLTQDINSELLQGSQKSHTKEYRFYSHLLRSNCPVTNQPDWGTLSVVIRTEYLLDYKKILAYILSFRQHNGFHEQCVEQVFADFLRYFSPESLLVQANYTRRGGIDINPVRVFNMALPTVERLVRQ